MTEEAAKYRIERPGWGGGAVAEVILSNPARHNVFDDTLIRGLTEAFSDLGGDAQIRVILLRAEGKSFSAGADLGWMKRMAENSRAENLADAEALAGLMQVMNACPKPVIGLVQGAAYGGGVGLAACCDIVVSVTAASFALSEVKLGIIPAAISPYVVAAIGQRAARRYFLTAERFDAAEARRLGLVHEIVEDEAALQGAAERLVKSILGNGPQAVAEAKALIFAVDRPWSMDVLKDTAERIARVRAGDEGREGVAAFLEKRKPGWIAGGGSHNG